ncbi:MAG: 30S ribosomal protein S6 [Patescibacteria group bacterium]|jgi:small subunit ribosomal protein S6
MNNYELLYIIPNQYTDDEAAKIKAKIDDMLKGFGAIIGLEENLGKKKLAYPINRVAHGYYLLNEFELEDAAKIKEINNFLRLDKEILRAQIVSKKKLTPKEIEKQKKREQAAEARRAAGEKNEEKAKPAEAKKESKKVDIKNLDEKLDEILKTDDLV